MYVEHRRLTDGDSIYRAVGASSVLEGLFRDAVLDSSTLPQLTLHHDPWENPISIFF